MLLVYSDGQTGSDSLVIKILRMIGLGEEEPAIQDQADRGLDGGRGLNLSIPQQ